jgi:hypothetical protein
MEHLTQMEVLMAGELLKVEEIAAKKAQFYSDNAHDPEIRRLLGSFADAHRQKIQGLVSKLKEYSHEGVGLHD